MTEAALTAARILHFAPVLALFGLAVFPLYTYPNRVGSPPARLGRCLRVRLRLAAVLALASGIAWTYLTVANMTGSLAGAADPDALWSVFRETGFGQVGIARLALIVALLVSVRACTRSDYPDWIAAGLSGLVLATLAGVGHTHVSDGAVYGIHVLADGAHLRAAGASGTCCRLPTCWSWPGGRHRRNAAPTPASLCCAFPAWAAPRLQRLSSPV
jgi:putative copper resistance protein D